VNFPKSFLADANECPNKWNHWLLWFKMTESAAFWVVLLLLRIPDVIRKRPRERFLTKPGNQPTSTPCVEMLITFW
jgi:hypothetical protein